jgi:2-amino-4-hydroxy-6-hydroxymethyldihydropteridine diphosphokinase
MIYIALGANLPSHAGAPLMTLKMALERFPAYGLKVGAVSHWYETAPVPVSDQPLYVNAVAMISTLKDAPSLLNSLLSIEDEFGRKRHERNAARTLDLDILDFDGRVSENNPILPHPRLQDRGFVLLPLRDVAPQWCHPVTGQGVDDLISSVLDVSTVKRISEDSGKIQV